MKTNTTTKFNIFAIPTGKSLLLAILLTAAGLGLLFGVPRVVPARTGTTTCPIESLKAPFSVVSRDEVAKTFRAYVLDNELDGGLFRSTPNAGDSLPSDEVTHMALVASRRLSALPYAELFPVTETNRLDAHIAKLLPHALAGELPLHRTYFLISIAKSLGNVEISADDVTKVTNRVAALALPSGGYRLGEYARQATVGGTYYALKTLEALGQLESAQASAENVAAYIRALQDPATGGFRDTDYVREQNSPATFLDDTFRALEVLRLVNANATTPAARASLLAARLFIERCRGLDGGFRRQMFVSAEDLSTSEPSAAAPTAMGLLAAAYLRDSGVPVRSAVTAGALDYLAACVTNKRGVSESPLSQKPSAEGAFYLAELAARVGAENVPLGRRSWVLGAAQWAAAVLFTAAAAAWFAPQLDSALLRRSLCCAAKMAAGLAVPAGVTLFCPRAALAAYGAYAALAVVPAVRRASKQRENAEGEGTVLAGAVGAVFLALVLGLQARAPFVFAGGAGAAAVLGVWAFAAAYAVAYAAGFVLAGKSREFYNAAATAAWGVAVVGAGVILFAEESPVYRLLVTRGLFVPFVVTAPVVVFGCMCLGAAVGSASFSCSAATRQYIKKLLARLK